MTTFNYFLEWGTIIITILALVVTAVVAIILVRRRDIKYKQRYEDFQRQKQRVEAHIKSARESHTGASQ